MAEIRFRVNGKDAALDANKIMFAEGRAIERVTGKPFPEVLEGMRVGSLDSMQAIVWIAFKRSEPQLKFSDLDEWVITDVEMPDLLASDDEGDEEPAPDPTSAGGSPAGENN